MKEFGNVNEKDEVLTRLSYGLAELVDTCIAALPPNTQNLIASTLEHGSQLAVLCVMNPWPTFIGTLMMGPDQDPVELFRVKPGSGSLRTPTTPTH